MNNLSKWNYAASLIHCIAAVATYNILNGSSKEKRTVQMVRSKYDESQSTLQDSRVDIPVSLENNAKIDLKFFVVSFFAVTSFAHLCYATDFFGKGWYSSQVLGFGWNPFRWIEYSISAGLMVYLISAVSGTKDQVSAITSALIVPGLMVNGFTTERALQQNALHKWSLHPYEIDKPKIDSDIVFSNLLPAWAFGFVVNWYIILSNYTKLEKEAKQSGKPLDKGVTFMVYSQFALFSLFGVIQTYQVYRWKTLRVGRVEPNFVDYEKAYILLSAFTKLVLAGTVVYALRN